MQRLIFILSVAILTAANSPAQTAKRNISGLVTCANASTPLEGVKIAAKGDNIVSGSQQDGQYYIEVPATDTVLVFSLEDYQTREIKLTADNEYNIALKPGQDAPQTNAPQTATPQTGSPQTATPQISISQTGGRKTAGRHPNKPFSALGPWRGIFELRPGVEVPFNFVVKADRSGQPKAFFRNAGESFEGGRVRRTADSFFVEIDQFDNELAFPIGEGTLKGSLRHQDGTGTPLTVRAEPGISYRFEDKGQKPAGNFSGTYDVTFTATNGKDEKVVGLFHQDGKTLTGTFLRITGDSRYLEGIVEGNNFYLSSFIGSGPSYFKGSFTIDGHLTGESVGARGSQSFTGSLDPKAALPDPYSLTYLKQGYDNFDFSFPDIDGNKIALKDAKFKNKVVIVTIGGTWCPNCVDEASFLAPWYKANRSRGIEIVSIQYERQTDTAFVRKVLSRMRQRYDIQYDQVFGGIADKQGVANSLPALNTFLAFPTTILINKQGKVVRIHTGYSGPAIGPYYEEFVKNSMKR
jgi:peroxiredoxin